MIKSYFKELEKLLEIEEEIKSFTDLIKKSSKDQRIILTGIGKNAIIAQMVYELLLPFNINCHTIDPIRAAHGNLGLIKPEDVVIMTSKSGNTAELIALHEMIRKKGLDLKYFLITSNPKGEITKLKGVHSLITPKLSEFSRFEHSPQNTILSYLLILMNIVTSIVDEVNMTETDYLLNHQFGEIGKSLQKNS